MRPPNVLKSKRGIAIENAIMFMVIIVSLCFLLSLMTLTGNYRVQLENVRLRNRVQIERIGEDYLASLEFDEAFSSDDYEGYACTVGENSLTVRRGTAEENASVVLYVEVARTDGEVHLVQWRYGEPFTAE